MCLVFFFNETNYRRWWIKFPVHTVVLNYIYYKKKSYNCCTFCTLSKVNPPMVFFLKIISVKLIQLICTKHLLYMKKRENKL